MSLVAFSPILATAFSSRQDRRQHTQHSNLKWHTKSSASVSMLWTAAILLALASPYLLFSSAFFCKTLFPLKASLFLAGSFCDPLRPSLVCFGYDTAARHPKTLRAEKQIVQACCGASPDVLQDTDQPCSKTLRICTLDFFKRLEATCCEAVYLEVRFLCIPCR